MSWEASREHCLDIHFLFNYGLQINDRQKNMYVYGLSASGAVTSVGQTGHGDATHYVKTSPRNVKNTGE